MAATEAQLLDRFMEWWMQVRAGMPKFMDDLRPRFDEDHVFHKALSLKGWFWEAFGTCHMDTDAVDDVGAIIKPVQAMSLFRHPMIANVIRCEYGQSALLLLEAASKDAVKD